MGRFSVDLLLEHERMRNAAPRDAKARSRKRLAAMLATAPLPAAAATASKVALTKLGAALLVGAAVGASVTAGTMTASAPDPTPAVLVAPAAPHVPKYVPKVVVTTNSEPKSQAPAMPVPSVTPTVSAPPTLAPSFVPRAPAAASPPADVLATERALLDHARSAIGRGDAATAMRDGEEHASRFPQGQLAAEREAILVRALVMGGRAAEARARADRFHRTYPNSPLAPVVEAALGKRAEKNDP